MEKMKKTGTKIARVLRRASLVALALLMLSACRNTDYPGNETGSGADSTAAEEETNMVTIADKNNGTKFTLVIDAKDLDETNVLLINDALCTACGVKMEVTYTSLLKDAKTDVILVGNSPRESSVQANAELGPDEYILRYCGTEAGGELVVAYSSTAARLCAIDRLIDEYITPDGFAVPKDLDIKGKCRESDMVITTKIPNLRDPYILIGDDGTYYAYGTGWKYYKAKRLDGAWSGPYSCVTVPADAADNHWAPEVHKYNGAYYMITTYKSAKTGRRGCTVLKASSPEGPFVEISDGHITPRDWDSIDGTLYVDENGQPWMIFVHEWVSAPEGVGRMAAAKLSDDLTHFLDEPVDLFGAKDPKWAKNVVTDGCFMYKATDGKLWMIWSNWDNGGYCVGLACSENGSVTGPWKQEYRRLYSKTMGFTYDGGHGMIFRDTDGSLKMALHSPNSSSAGRAEIPVIFPITERYGQLVLDFWQKEE